MQLLWCSAGENMYKKKMNGIHVTSILFYLAFSENTDTYNCNQHAPPPPQAHAHGHERGGMSVDVLLFFFKFMDTVYSLFLFF